MYEIWIYGLSDALAYEDNVYSGSRSIVLDNTDEDMDQPPIAELAAGNIVEAILRGVQEMAEIYMVGHVDYYNDGPDYNNLVITVLVSADTVESGQEQNLDNNGQNYNPNSQSFYDVVGSSVDAWAYDHSEDWDGLDVYPTYLQGDGTSYYGLYALAKLDPVNVAVKDAQQARGAAMKAARIAANKVSYTPKMKR
jgi:hypothetical protein